jgi:hypothetical protein
MDGLTERSWKNRRREGWMVPVCGNGRRAANSSRRPELMANTRATEKGLEPTGRVSDISREKAAVGRLIDTRTRNDKRESLDAQQRLADVGEAAVPGLVEALASGPWPGEGLDREDTRDYGGSGQWGGSRSSLRGLRVLRGWKWTVRKREEDGNTPRRTRRTRRKKRILFDELSGRVNGSAEIAPSRQCRTCPVLRFVLLTVKAFAWCANLSQDEENL